jgi:hypothetical protein
MPSYTNVNGKKEPYDNVSKVFVVSLKDFLDTYPLTDVASKMRLIKNWLQIELGRIRKNAPSRQE